MSDGKNPQVPRELTDEELAGVAGGTHWDYNEEFSFLRRFDPGSGRSFESFLKFQGVSDEQLQCRQAWLANGSKSNLRCEVDDTGNMQVVSIR